MQTESLEENSTTREDSGELYSSVYNKPQTQPQSHPQTHTQPQIDSQVTHRDNSDIGRLFEPATSIQDGLTANSDIEGLANAFAEDPDLVSSDQGFQPGCSIVNFHDLRKVKKGNQDTDEKQRFREGLRYDYWETQGDLLRSPDGYVQDDVRIHLTKSGALAIKRYLPKTFVSGPVLIFRASERLHACIPITEEQVKWLCERDVYGWKVPDSYLVRSIPAFAKLSHSKLASWQRENYRGVIGQLLAGFCTKAVMDEDMIPITRRMVRDKYCDTDIHKVNETYFRFRYDREYVQTVIDRERSILK